MWGTEPMEDWVAIRMNERHTRQLTNLMMSERSQIQEYTLYDLCKVQSKKSQPWCQKYHMITLGVQNLDGEQEGVS